MIDLEKRRRIMQRSIKLGHCICNPKQGCPCDTFKTKDICPCAGERLDHAVENVLLTSLVEKAGCASKINQSDLKKALEGLPEIRDPRVLVGTNTCDDAGVYRLDDETALVQTVDVFSPSVDDPYSFGQVAAANSLSDVYAMGGTPMTALSVIGFPIEDISPRVMTQMLRGGMDKMTEAGVSIVGGHSINDKEPKFGYAVTGVINPSNIVANANAQPGDVLVLTKPIGVGVISFAAQVGKASISAADAARESMCALNKIASEVMLEVGVNAATDVTGFGLLGHLSEMVSQSGVTAEIYAQEVPVFPEALEYIAQGVISGGIERNREFAERFVTADGIPEDTMHLLYDPQTSGGLLISVPEERANELVERLHSRGVPHAAIIGRIREKSEGRILITASTAGTRPLAVLHRELPVSVRKLEVSAVGVQEEACCASPPGDEIASAGGMNRSFADFMRNVNAEGAVSLRSKELIAIALSVLTKCEPCVKLHLDKARSMGISEDEISEAVWLAISFGGAPIKMFYDTINHKEEL